MTYGVNVLAPYLLTGLLLDVVRLRIVNVASISAAYSIGEKAQSSRLGETQQNLNVRHPIACADVEALRRQQGTGVQHDGHEAYSRSKLLNIVFTRKLAQLLGAAGRTALNVRVLDPGTVNTKMLYSGWGAWGMDLSSANDLFEVCAKDTESSPGARSSRRRAWDQRPGLRNRCRSRQGKS